MCVLVWTDACIDVYCCVLMTIRAQGGLAVNGAWGVRWGYGFVSMRVLVCVCVCVCLCVLMCAGACAGACAGVFVCWCVLVWTDGCWCASWAYCEESVQICPSKYLLRTDVCTNMY